jgi:hypothetical protein
MMVEVCQMVVRWCMKVYAISHNAFVVGLVGFIDIYVVLKERGNTIFTQVG